MQWNRWYVAKSYLNSALWIVPLVALLLENVVIRLVFVLHNWLDWIPWFGTTVTGATEALNTIEALTTAFIVFTFGSLLLLFGRQWPASSVDRYDAAAEQRHQIHGRAIHLHHDVCRRHRCTFRYRGAKVCRNDCVGTRHRIDRSVFLLDRLYGAVAPASQHRRADRRKWDQGYRKRLSRND